MGFYLNIITGILTLILNLKSVKLIFFSITLCQDNPGVVVCIEDERHAFSHGSKVCFTEVQGMTELNSIGPVEIQVRG